MKGDEKNEREKALRERDIRAQQDGGERRAQRDRHNQVGTDAMAAPPWRERAAGCPGCNCPLELAPWDMGALVITPGHEVA